MVKKLLKEKDPSASNPKGVGEIFFSSSTYQVEIEDNARIYWPLLQVNDEGQLLDAICSCASDITPCPHSETAYKAILGKTGIPLHLRFEESLWFQITDIASKRSGYEVEESNLKEAVYTAYSPVGKRLFQIEALNDAGKVQFESIFLKRAKKDEENAIEFSNRDPEEIRLWKQGRKPHRLSFDLSFWCDLAKWWFFLQEKKLLKSVQFLGETGALPKVLEVVFKDVKFVFYIAETNWDRLIPSLNSCPSSLKVFEEPKEAITKLRFDEMLKGFHVKKEIVTKEAAFSINLGRFLYVQGEGFYPLQSDPIFDKSFIEEKEVSYLLDHHFSYVQKITENISFSKEQLEARYHLFFDEKAALHIQLYIQTIGDISALFGKWVYLQDQGFFPLHLAEFAEIEKVIAKEEVPEFISLNKRFLNERSGFATHVSSLESQLSYKIEANDDLKFIRGVTQDLDEMIDFGAWIYLPTRGFFSKKSSEAAPSLKAGLRILAKDVGNFIHRTKEELTQVVQFFAKESPIIKASLFVGLKDKDKLILRPEYTLKEGYVLEDLHFYGPYVYLSKEGFSEVPKEAQLLEGYQTEKTIPAYEIKAFLERSLPQMRCEVLLDKRLQIAENPQLAIRSVRKQKERGQWEFSLAYETENGVAPLRDLWEAYKGHKPYVFTKAGRWDLTDPRFSYLGSIQEEDFDPTGQLTLSSFAWYKLQVYEEPVAKRLDDESAKGLEELQSLHTKHVLDLSNFNSELRPYQEIGVHWLLSLYLLGLSALLCDDMGLGKTHQAMGLIAAAKNMREGVSKKILIVCPTSVIFHWETQLQRFLPSAKVALFYGTSRSLKHFDAEGEILITSYGVLRSEHKKFAERKFDIAIYDELQVAKNPSSKTHKALKGVHAAMILGLSGTPIENRLDELHALFDLVMPSYLPKLETFRENFILPIEKDRSEKASIALKKIIRPFLLRRKKQEVLKDLPAKVEEIAYCGLSPEQKELYQAAVAGSKKRLTTEKDSFSYVHIFALLTELKRICDHPYLITKDPEHLKEYAQSGKWELFVQLVQEARDSSQKVVVFSQYLDMLDIIEHYLKEQKIGYAQIRGSTQNRREEVRKFQEDPHIEVFLASLQAAGVGVDLTAGSVVIHYDRWWNPAKENQATDRVHRIGQSKGVQVFKMVTKGTIEERIHELIESKMALISDVLPHDDEEEVRSLNKEELLNILLNLE